MGQLICKVVEVLVGLLATGISINNTGNAQPLSKIKKKSSNLKVSCCFFFKKNLRYGFSLEEIEIC